MKLATLLALLMACNSQPAATTPLDAAPGSVANPGETVLTVDGATVGTKELELVFQRMRVPKDQVSGYAWTRGGKHIAEEYALATVLYNKAIEQRLDQDPDVQLQAAFAVRQVLGAALREKLARAAITDEAVQKFYDKNKDRYSKPEVHARHILTDSATKANDILARLKGGEKFDELAKHHSLDQTGPSGGDVGWFQEHENPLFGPQAFAAKQGDVLGPLETTLGFHIVEVLGKRDSRPMADVRPEAEARLLADEATRVIDEIRTGLKIEWVKEPEAGEAPQHAPPPVDGAAPQHGGAPPQHGGGSPDGAAAAPPHGAPPAAPPHGTPAGAKKHGTPGGG